MVKYKVNLKFKENGKSLNETITNVLKIELEKKQWLTVIFDKLDFKLKPPRWEKDRTTKEKIIDKHHW